MILKIIVTLVLPVAKNDHIGNEWETNFIKCKLLKARPKKILLKAHFLKYQPHFWKPTKSCFGKYIFHINIENSIQWQFNVLCDWILNHITMIKSKTMSRQCHENSIHLLSRASETTGSQFYL